MKKKKDSFFKDLKRYFETTPQEVLDKDFEEIMSENQEGPDMLDILRDGKAGMPTPYRGGMKALFVLLVCNVSFYCFFRDMSDALAIIRTRPQCREAAP